MFPEEVTAVLHRLEQAGHQAYMVGGCVRDRLRGVAPDDYDLTTSARPEEVMALFPGWCIPTGLQHGTVTVRQGEKSFEVTTFRSDGAYTDSRHPDAVYFSDTLAEDLKRRDFTVNAMAMDVRGELTDLFGGQEDLRAGVLRCVGDPATRFGEDALRMMRAVRFASVLGFRIEGATAQAIREHCGLLRNIAVERLQVEMTKLLCGKDAGKVLMAWPEVFGVFIPEILPCVGLDQRNPHHIYDVWGHIAHSVDAVPAVPVLRWAMLLHDIGKPECFTVDEAGVGHFHGHAAVSTRMAGEILRRLRFDNHSLKRTQMLVEWHDRDIPRTEKSVARALRLLGEEALRQVILVKRADNLAQSPRFRDGQKEIDRGEAILEELLAKEQCFSLRQLAVNGRDLMALGLRGRAVGQMLESLLDEVVDGQLPNDRQALLHRAGEKIEQ